MKYLATLKSMEPFFFGGEQTFGKDDTRKESSRYSAKSTYFPQQTAILGMIRKTLLVQNGNLTMHKKGEWVDSRGGRAGNDKNYFSALSLAGKDAFSYEKEIDLGRIKNISPLFITKKDEDYIVNAKDSEYEPIVLGNSKMFTSKETKTLVMKGFNAKEYKENVLISTAHKTLSFDEVFKKVQTVGIKKSTDAEANEDGFFQKTSYTLKDGAYFSFYLDMDCVLEWEKTYVALGADQSSFVLELKETNDTFENKFENTIKQKNMPRLVLTSETLVSVETYDLCHFVFGSKEPYRQLRSKNGQKSKRYYLLQRGSVLYSANIEKLSATLSQTHLQKVGINKFIAIKGA